MRDSLSLESSGKGMTLSRYDLNLHIQVRGSSDVSPEAAAPFYKLQSVTSEITQSGLIYFSD